MPRFLFIYPVGGACFSIFNPLNGASSSYSQNYAMPVYFLGSRIWGGSSVNASEIYSFANYVRKVGNTIYWYSNISNTGAVSAQLNDSTPISNANLYLYTGIG